MTATWYEADYQSQEMAEGGSAVRIFVLYLVSELGGLGGPRYEFGNMNCPCGGGYRPEKQMWEGAVSWI